MTIKELQNEKIKIRKTDLTRSIVLGNLVEGAKKIAKEEHREPNDNDIVTTAKKIIKTLSKTLDDITNKSLKNSYIREIEICKEFLPKMADENEVIKFIDEKISVLDNKSMKNMGTIIKSVKEKFGETVDMGFVSKIVKEKLK